MAAEAPSLPHSALSPQPRNDAHSGHKHVIGAVIIGLGVFCVVASLCLLLRNRLFPVLSQRWIQKANLKAGKLLLRQFQLEELKRATNNFSEDCLLGTGAFGKVYKGTFEVEGTLAIKRAHADSYQSVEEFRNEVTLLSKVKHRNLLGLVGFCEETRPNGAKILVYEYVPNGSLLEYIMGKKGRSLTWRQRVNIAIGAAKGIAHLHYGVNPTIIHRDIKPSNILVGEGFEAKVSDFGLVKMGPVGDKSHVSSQIKGTPGYLDPAYCSSFHLSPFSDVYSFGVILLQLVSARPAVDSTRNQSNYHISEWARPSLESGNVKEILDANLLTEPCDMEVMLKMGQLGLRCVVQNPKERPTMTRVWRELEEALRSADHKEPSRGSRRSSTSSRLSVDHGPRRSTDNNSSQSFVSVDGVGMEKFHIEMDSMSLHSASLRCFETSLDIDKNSLRGILEESGTEEELSLTSS